jgi:UrcA family protein
MIAASVFALALSLDAATPTLRIQVSDLNLNTAAGRQAWSTRLDAGARSFCAEYRTLVTPGHVRAGNYCERAVRAAGQRVLVAVQRRAAAGD